MHITIGAAILILGLLGLATFRAGRMVLLAVMLVGGVAAAAGIALLQEWQAYDRERTARVLATEQWRIK